MSTHQTLDMLVAMRRAASDAGWLANERRRELWRASRSGGDAWDAHREWSLIAQACRRELQRLNALITRRKRAQQVPA